MNQEEVKKEKCPECGAVLVPIIGGNSVLILCLNHKKAKEYKITKGNKSCDFQMVVDKKQYYFPSR